MFYQRIKVVSQGILVNLQDNQLYINIYYLLQALKISNYIINKVLHLHILVHLDIIFIIYIVIIFINNER